MTAEQALLDAYGEWRRLARAAHRAICRRDWNFLFECQSIIQKNQPFITDLTQEARKEWKRQKADCEAKEKELHLAILELKKLLESNTQLLHNMRETALAEREKLGRAGRNLKRLQNSYVFAPSPAWTSFS
jgi:hypothetical protein